MDSIPELHRKKENDDRTGDRTGDSGMGTGSCSADYDGRDQWKQAMKSPPPGENFCLVPSI